MKRAFILILLILVFSLSYCFTRDTNRKHYVFKGENEDWIARCYVYMDEHPVKKDSRYHYHCYADKVLRLAYKHELSKLSGVREIVIKYSGIGEIIELTSTYNVPTPQKTFTDRSRNITAEGIDKEEVIEVAVSLDGVTQTFELKLSSDFELDIDDMVF